MQYGMLTFKTPEPDISRKILHVDMDAFYASIEVRDKPSIKNRPVVIATHPNLTGGKGIVSTCNYHARKYGIHSAMPAIKAYQLCPKAVFIPPRMSYYAEISRQIHQVFKKYTDCIEPMSLDEAYLDVTDNKIGEKSALKIATLIQKEVYQAVHLTCSIGVSYNKFIAKIASDYRKPEGITLVTPNQAVEFLKKLPIEKFHGVGQKSVEKMYQLGIYTGEQLYEQELEYLVDNFGKMGYLLYHKVRGISSNRVNTERVRKSIGKETTFSPFIQSNSVIFKELEILCDKVMKKMVSKGYLCKTIVLKIRYYDFETLTRQYQADDYFNNVETAYKIIQQLWTQWGNSTKTVRLLGVSVTNLIDPSKQAMQLTIED